MAALKDLFPVIRSRREVITEINANPNLKNVFISWKPEHQEYFLEFCTGIHGMKILYDTFFKTIFNPDDHPDRLISLLSVILDKKIDSIRLLNNASVIIHDNNPIIFFDIIVTLDDGSIVNVEMQKHGFKFPGQRAACYCSDLVIRQYTNIREKNKEADYSKLKPAYTIVFLETSPKAFHAFPNNYIHSFSQRSDTGLDLPLLQNYIFIPLDIFSQMIETKAIKDRNPLESWLTFLSTEEPEDIEQIIKRPAIV
jgi:predicted transposase/invertase (TIGR01784 family)